MKKRTVLAAVTPFLLLICAVAFIPKTAQAAVPSFGGGNIFDDNTDGTADRINVVLLNGPFTSCDVSAGELASDWTYTGNTMGGSLGSASCSGSGVVIISFTLVGANAGVTGGTPPTIAYNDTDGDHSVANVSGPLAAFGPVSLSDDTSPVYLSKSPAAGATRVDRSSPFVLTFSEPMNTGTYSLGTTPTATYTPVWTNSNKTVTLSHSTLSPNTTYAVTTSGAGTSTHSISGPVSGWTFKTKPTGGAYEDIDSTSDSETSVAAPQSVGPVVTVVSSEPVTPPVAVPVVSTVVSVAPGVITPALPIVVAPLVIVTFTKNLKQGATGNEVTKLQNFLIKQSMLVFPSGTPLGYYGKATAQAVLMFQTKYALLANGSAAGAGQFGPKTRTQAGIVASVSGSN